MTGGALPTREASAPTRAGGFLHSTGLKMFVVLTLALLPLGLIALVASLQAIRSADLEKEALLRVAVTQSARKLSADLQSDRTALALSANAFSQGKADAELCARLAIFLRSHNDRDGAFYVYDRAGKRLCGTSRPEPPGISPEQRFGRPALILLPRERTLVSRVLSRNGQVVALNYYSRSHLASVADSVTAVPNRQLSIRQGDGEFLISRPMREAKGRRISLSARLDQPDVILTMTMHDPPATLARMLSLFLPLVMWFAAAAIGWFVVNRLLIRPLVLLRRVVAAYQPGQVLEPMARVRTPALEINALAQTFRSISEDVATHEAELAEGLDAQRKLTREVHHRVKNNLQIIASLISLHARSAHDAEAVEAYASIQRRVDALSVVHRNHFAELEENRGVGVRALVSELSASLRGTAPHHARRFAIQIESDNLHIHQDVAVPVAFLVTELVELTMELDPQGAMRITVEQDVDRPDRALFSIRSEALKSSEEMNQLLDGRYGRVLTGLSRQLRAPLEHDGESGSYSIFIAVTP